MFGIVPRQFDALDGIVRSQHGGLVGAEAVCQRTDEGRGVHVACAVTALGDLTRYYEHRKIAKGCHGTGDVYASAFVGALANGFNAYEAAVLAAKYTVKCIELTQDDSEHWYGVKFELALPEYIHLLGK